jgi:WD40 repeat protein
MGSDIIEYDMNQNMATKISEGHFKGETWGLDVHPTERLFVTCGDEGSVMVWDGPRKTLRSKRSLGAQCRAVCYSSDGSEIACGLSQGHLVILSNNLREVVAEKNVGRDWI